MAARIPPIAHFVWLGPDLPWVYRLAIRSAAARGGFERVVLHHEPALRDGDAWVELAQVDGVELRTLDPEAILSSAPRGDELAAIYPQLDHAAARANVLRAAILHAEGGVYLDTDTVTIRSLEPLMAEAGAFCGEEHVVYPASVRRSRNPLVRVPALLRSVARDALREAPGGWRAFRHVERFYPTAVNNAVLASAPGHAFIRTLLEAMTDVPPDRRLRRFSLGTHLLQQTVAEYRGPGLRVHPPPVFYPLGPEISSHWFRTVDEPRLDDVLHPTTHVVHWYASVRTRDIVPRIDPAYVRARARHELFSALALPFL